MFKKVENFEHFKALIREGKMAFGSLGKSNLYLFGEALRKLVERGLYFSFIEGGLCFFEPQNEKLKMYYMVKPDLKRIDLDEDCVIVEFIEKGDARISEGIAFFAGSGFSLRAVYDEMVSPVDKNSRQAHFTGIEEVSFPKAEEAKQILRLWEEQLDTSGHPLPREDELLRYIEAGQIIVIRNENKRLIGAMNRRIENSVCFIEYAAVAADYQSMGYGGKMLDSCRRDQNVNKLRLFVNHDDKRAIHFYDIKGFKATGKKLVQFYK